MRLDDLRVFLCLAALSGITACDPAVPSGPCDEVAACCDSNPFGGVDACYEVADQGDSSNCSSFLEERRGAGECTSGGVDAGMCGARGASCTSDLDCCPSGDDVVTSCTDSVCTRCTINGGSCSADTDCCGGICDEGGCTE